MGNIGEPVRTVEFEPEENPLTAPVEAPAVAPEEVPV